LEGLILRPLSAKFLEPTIPEKEKLVNREKLLSIRGRSRKPQMKLAQEFSIKDYSCPAGGCRLTDSQFARRIKESFEHNEVSLNDIILLKYGRHFRLLSNAKVVVGRNMEENTIIRNLAKENDLLFEVVGYPGPTALLRNMKDENDTEIAGSICARYSDGKNEREVEVRVWNEKQSTIIKSSPMKDKQVEKLMIERMK
jgi:hypothetical protein